MTDVDEYDNDEHCSMQPRCGLAEDAEEFIGGECVHCECCCTCLGCEYGPRDGMLMPPIETVDTRGLT